MKHTLLYGLSLFFGSFLFAQNSGVNQVSSKPTAAANLPYSYGFETVDLDEWQMINEGSGNNWKIAQASLSTPAASEGTYYMMYEFHKTEPGNAYLYSKGLNLKAGKEITLQFDYMGVDAWFPEKMEVRIGTATTVAGQTTQLWINDDIWNYPFTTATVKFNVPTDDVYYLSFRAFSDPNQFYLSLDNIKVFETVLGTQNVTKSSLKFYPNPVKDILTIADTQEISSVEIFDVSGKKVVSKSGKSSQLDLNVTQLKAGVYVGKTNSNGVVKTFKFIKK